MSKPAWISSVAVLQMENQGNNIYLNAKNWKEILIAGTSGKYSEKADKVKYIIITEDGEEHDFDVPENTEKAWIDFSQNGEEKSGWWFKNWQPDIFKEFYKNYLIDNDYE
jgi:hypothetical protein